MRRFLICAAAFAGLPGAATAQPAGAAIYMAETCLRLGDAAFEQSLGEGADVEVLTQVYATATFECLGLSMEICEGQDASVACLGALEAWVRDARLAVVARLPEAVEGDAAEPYAGALALAGQGPDESNCEEMTQEQRARYCALVAEGLALEDTYVAWRMARREGAMALEGHAPIDLETIQ